MRLGVNGTLMYYKMDFVSLCNVVMGLCACAQENNQGLTGVLKI